MPLTITPPAITVQPEALTVTPAPIIVTPPAVSVQPAAVSVTDAQMVSALQADGYTVTAPGTTQPPPPPPTGAIVLIDGDGQLGPQFGGSPTPSDVLLGTPGNPGSALIGGNWNSNYAQTVGAAAPDGSKALQLTPDGAWPIWLPYGYAKAGNPTPNGHGTDLTGKQYFEASVYVAAGASAGTFTLGLAENLGAGSYVGPNAPTAEQMGPVTYNVPALVPGWNAIKVPLSALGLPWSMAPASSAPYFIYKLAMQQHLENGQTVWIKNAQFV